MNTLIIGGGGREHALAWKLAQSPKVHTVYVAPGNAGTQQEPKVINVPIEAHDLPALLDFAQQQSIALTLVGPEAPLVAGIVDQFQAAGLPCFGPTQFAAQLEGSKAFAKHFLKRHQIPTANYATFTDPQAALDYLQTQGTPIVIKADGLAAGKGVVVAQTPHEAQQAIQHMLVDRLFGQAGQQIIIEDYLTGEEASFICMVDGEHILPLATSQDHKARDEGDQGPNTGGMGAYSPAPVITPDVHARIMANIILPTVQGLAKEGHSYTGFLYAGLMIDAAGNPKVLEYNCRLGDPETQPILLRLKTDLVELCLAALNKNLHQIAAEWDHRDCLGVVLAAQGYPGPYQTGQTIPPLPKLTTPNAKIFHAGTLEKQGYILLNGGRVFCVCGLGTGIQNAQRTAYELINHMNLQGLYYRKDIGYRAIAREKFKGHN